MRVVGWVSQIHFSIQLTNFEYLLYNKSDNKSLYPPGGGKIGTWF